MRKKAAKNEDGTAVPAGEHIFPATKLTQLALQWKEKHANGQHREAMEILDEIIRDSTAMFERFAQHEHYHRVVDLSILVSAAQEKVVRWLMAWDPAEGRLFTWFSHSGDTRLLCADGQYRRLDDIVNNRLAIDVVSWDEQAGQLVNKPIAGWSKQPSSIDEYRKVSVTHPCGVKRSFYATHEHRLLTTSRGWVKVDDLTPSDRLLMRSSKLTPKGQSAVVGCKAVVKHAKGCSNLKSRRDLIERPGERYYASSPNDKYGAGSYTPDFNWKYDVTVEGTQNFLAEDVISHNSKCAKNAFRSEVVKVNQYRKRFYTTSDNPERIMFIEHDPSIDRQSAAENVHSRIKSIACRWGDPQEIGAIRWFLAGLEDLQDGVIDKQALIRGACFAYGISQDMSKFFYTWALMALRDAMYDQIKVPFTEQDIFNHHFSYTLLPDLLTNVLTWDQLKKLIAIYGGQRFKIPTLTQVTKVVESMKIYEEIVQGGMDPGSVSKVAKKYGKTDKSAEEIYREMTETLNPNRAGEYPVYDEHEHEL